MDDSLESRIQKTGEHLYRLVGDQSPSVFKKGFWLGKAMEWSMRDPEFKANLFRFVDVFPSLTDAADIARHAREYFGDDAGGLMGKVGLKALSGGMTSAVAARFLSSNIEAMGRQFIVGVDPKDALRVLSELRAEGLAFTVSLLGEAVLSETEADDYCERYLDVLDALSAEANRWPAIGGTDALDWERAPRVNMSVKPSALYSQMSARSFENSIDCALGRLRRIMAKAVELNASVCLDMEHHELKALTLALYRRIMEEDAFRDYPFTGLAMQAYLKETENDLANLLEWTQHRTAPITIRLVKGAYWDSEIAWARQKYWPEPVFLDKAQTDAVFERCARRILEAPNVHLACGTHNIRSQAAVIEMARETGVPDSEVEFQVLYGMAEPVRRALVREGHRVRLYAPIGALIPGMAYLVRRLLENTSNESFLRREFVEQVDAKELLRAPDPAPPVSEAVPDASRFRNEPPRDWTVAEDRTRFREALAATRARFPIAAPLVIGAERVQTKITVESLNPNDSSEVVGVAASASVKELDRSVEVALKAFPSWRDTPTERRAEILFKAASVARERREELAALEVYEAGKNWDEADADVCEAIDFLEYYGREIIRLGNVRDLSAVPGEFSELFYEPRGVAGVIAPWNFPIAISVGMVSAALVTGNTVVYKPSSESPICGAAVWELFADAGLPPGVLNFVPGRGGAIGHHLVMHHDVWLIAFTGSRDVGLSINRHAANASGRSPNVKRVITEMGGKNAIIVDTDADLDAAVREVLRSAFGYQGQKCSACSRLIVLDAIHDALLERLKEAAESVVMGPAEDPSAFMGAVISEDAAEKIRSYIAVGKEEGRLVLERSPEKTSGFAVPMAIFAGIEPEHRLAQEEIFGPVLSVLRARDFDDAIHIANHTWYALTGAVFSRSPQHIRQAREQFRVGNLYINRGSTGAMVGRHPFGGFKMSGVGSKAGGPDYLPQFMVPRSVVENTIRRSYTPDVQ